MRSKPRRDAAAVGALALIAVLALLSFDPTGSTDLLRARAFDGLLGLTKPPKPPLRVVVIDIDDDALNHLGPWPWRREQIAALIEAARAAGAAAIGVDILFAAPDSQSPAALARRLAAETDDPHVRDLAASLRDDDARLAQAAAGGRVALGFALAAEEPSSDAPATTPMLARGRIDLGDAWTGDGVYPPPQTAGGGALGALSLPGDADGIVRRAPLAVVADGALRPGLALETLRLARGASAYLVQDNPSRIVSGAVAIDLARDGMLRLTPRIPRIEIAPALRALDGKLPDLKDALVFIGASAPEAGGLRAAPGDPLTPSVVIQARAAAQIAAGFAPLELPASVAWVLGAALGLALIAVAILAPAPAAYGGAVCALAAVFAATVAAAGLARLIDPIEIAAPAAAAFAGAAGVMGAAARRRARRLRARFERHLAPSVIARIVANDAAPKLASERRDVTALFTDIEGFTPMVSNAAPEALVAVLDGYFDGVTRIALAHGGMMDKFVGDATHVFFNMPFDLADHPRHALDCAEAISRWTEAYRQEPGPAALGFGRTRIGLESGPALVGEVGSGAKLDYTAHGETVNAAARLEQANKFVGSAICVGPRAASRIAPDRLRPVGALRLRGFSAPVAAASPWPQASPEWRARYLAAFALRETEPARARAAFAELAKDIEDPVAARLAEDAEEPF